MLSTHISKRIDKLLGRRIIRRSKEFTMCFFKSLGDIKKPVETNKLIKNTKKYKILETPTAILNKIKSWVKKLVLDWVIDAVIGKLFIIIIRVAGKETYIIYSKSVFNKDVSIDSGVNELLRDIEEDIISNIKE